MSRVPSGARAARWVAPLSLASASLIASLDGSRLAAPAFEEARSSSSEAVRPVDDALCVDCHPAQTAGWRASGMARALGPVEAEEVDGLAPVLEEPTGLVYRFDAVDGAARLVEERAGEPPHATAWPLAFAIGAGRLDRSFALAAHGRWWFAPLEVVAEHVAADGVATERHAALAPPHAMQPGSRAGLPITSECLACHTDRLPPDRWPLNLAVAPATWEPEGITCGACHDRAAEHAAWREADLTGAEVDGDDPLVRHAGFSREQRLSVCAACHLQGDARLELVPGRFAIPAPGGDLLDARAVYVAAEAGNEVGFVSHVERLLLSECYLRSEPGGEGVDGAGLVCERCHDPHRPLDAPGETARVRAACESCHAGPHTGAPRAAGACGLDAEALATARTAGRDCVACHMPLTPVFDVEGVRVHDHWIRTRPRVAAPPATLRFAESAEGDWRRFTWPGAEPPAHVDDPGLDLMAFAARGHADRAAALVDARPGVAAVRLPMYHQVRAGVLEALGRPAEAERAYRVALALDPSLASARTNLGGLLARAGRAGEALEQLDQVVAAHPRMDSALRNRALAHAAAGDEEAFVQDLERAYRALPDADVAAALARNLERRGQLERARRWWAAARTADPLRPPETPAAERSSPDAGDDG